MSKLYPFFFILIGIGSIISGCETGISGNLNENLPPKTFLTVNEINIDEENRFSSQINISWWGDDPDGYIKGYEYAINDTSESAWSYTQKTDSVFVLPISFGQEVDDVLFKVRAIDNDGEKDPVGAEVIFPIKNTPPTVQIVNTESAPDTSFSIVSFGWVVGDPDGLINVSKTEIAFNDTNGVWIEIPLIQEEDQLFIALEIGDTSTELFRGRSLQETGITIEGIEQNAVNTFYVRTIDQAGASSPIDTLSWYVKEQQSNILFLNDVSLSNHQEIIDFHFQQLSTIGFDQVDYWQINDGIAESERKAPLSAAFPGVIDPILKMTLAQWDHIYWVSNDVDRNITYAQEILSDFFNEGGTVFFNIPIKRIPDTDPILNFLPVREVAAFSGLQSGPLIRGNTDLTPVNSHYPVLKVTKDVVSVYPFNVSSGATPLYDAEVRARLLTGGTDVYEGPSTVALKNPEGSMIFFGIDLMMVNGNNNASELLDQVLNNDLCFDGSCR